MRHEYEIRNLFFHYISLAVHVIIWVNSFHTLLQCITLYCTIICWKRIPCLLIRGLHPFTPLGQCFSIICACPPHRKTKYFMPQIAIDRIIIYKMGVSIPAPKSHTYPHWLEKRCSMVLQPWRHAYFSFYLSLNIFSLTKM